MNSTVNGVRRTIQSNAITHSRDNRMPVQIAEVIAHGYIPQESKKRDSMKMGEGDSLAFHNMRSILSQRDEFSQRQRIAGETSREWQRKVSGEHCYHRRGIIDE